MVAAGLSLFCVPFFGHLSDRIGRKRMYMIGAAATLVWGVPYFLLLDSRVGARGPGDRRLTDPARHAVRPTGRALRYSGAGLGYQLASVFAGGPAPLLATWMLHTFDSSTPIGIYIALCGVVTLIATALLPEPNRAKVAREFERSAPAPAPRPVVAQAPRRTEVYTGTR